MYVLEDEGSLHASCYVFLLCMVLEQNRGRIDKEVTDVLETYVVSLCMDRRN